MTWIYFLVVAGLIGYGTWRLYRHDREAIRREAEYTRRQAVWRQGQEKARRWKQ